ncbi:RGCVC family protein [Blastococcus sp. CT_GayMR16]|uniref:RGCVC family protein n=1 Tax=Blastococcus sp. CT_GayMR16 TaxID=2559607 RepID=UPI001073F911|nr:RGCVC family protein [Blastococcus sp. CT_GayMR16]TFV89103.1 hypothetical protein E4P38_08100 [Blastococcus sp. CT_GayMR16]
MTSAPTAPTTVPVVQTDGPVSDGGCAVCPHPLVAHDAISLRYCRATEAQAATTRGCVCPAK